MIWLLCGLLWAQDGLSDPPLGEPPAIEDRAQIVYTIAKDLRCPTCQGVSVADSSADGAMAMKARIEELVSQGYTSDQVFDYFVEKYGEWILLRPKKDHVLLWFAPVILFGIGGAFFLLRSGTKQEESAESSVRTVSSYRESILRELEED